MQKVKMPKSDSYEEFLIESLKDSEHAAGFIEAILEEKDPEPALLSNAVRKVVEARMRMNKLSDSTQLKYEKLDKLLMASGCAEIYAFVELLDALGFKLTVTLKDDELMIEEAVEEEGNSPHIKAGSAANFEPLVQKEMEKLRQIVNLVVDRSLTEEVEEVEPVVTKVTPMDSQLPTL